MAYDEGLAQRIRECLTDETDVVEKQMFGGIAFMLGGNMAVGVTGDELMVRVGTEAHEQAMQSDHVRPFDMTGRPMKGWVVVGVAGIESEADLRHWVNLGTQIAKSLPPK